MLHILKVYFCAENLLQLLNLLSCVFSACIEAADPTVFFVFMSWWRIVVVCVLRAGNLCLSSEAQIQVKQSGTSTSLIQKDCLLSICPLPTQVSLRLASVVLKNPHTSEEKTRQPLKQKVPSPNSPIWPSLHFGCATTLPPIQKNSSASLEMDALCHSFGELIMDGEGEFKGLGSFFAWRGEPRTNAGENIPAERDPRDWKVVFLCDMDVSGGLSLSPGDKGAIAGVLLIPELYIGVQLESCPTHITWTHLPLLSDGLLSKACLQRGSSPAGFSVSISSTITLPAWGTAAIFPFWQFQTFLHILSPVIGWRFPYV